MQSSPASSIWGKSATELLDRPEPAKLTLPDFQSLCADFVDRIVWDRWSDEEIIDGLNLRAKYHNKRISKEDCTELIKARREAHERSGIELPDAVQPGREGLPHYIVPRKDKNHAGWFPRGHVSLIAGSSGMGKTTAMMYLLEDIRNSRSVAGHPAATADYRVLIVDRTVAALEESLEFKGLDETAVLSRAASTSHEDGDPAKVLRRHLRQWTEKAGTPPDVIFLEGIDFWVRKNNDLDAVFRFVKTLEPVAEAWNVAIVASIGSPKIKAKDNYVLTRDKVLGTSAWGRTTHTILFVERQEASDTRKITVLTRTGRDEHIYFRFDDGRAIFSDVEPSEEGLANLNVRTDQQKAIAKHQAEIKAMREIIEPMPAGEKIPLTVFDFIGKNLTRTQRMNELSMAGLVEKAGGCWRRK